MTQNHSGFFFNHHAAALVLSALVQTAGHDYSQLSPACTRNRGFHPKTQPADMPIPTDPPCHGNCAPVLWGMQGAPTDCQRNPFFSFLLAANLHPQTLACTLLACLSFCKKQRSRGQRRRCVSAVCDPWLAAQRSPFTAIHKPRLTAAHTLSHGFQMSDKKEPETSLQGPVVRARTTS